MAGSHPVRTQMGEAEAARGGPSRRTLLVGGGLGVGLLVAWAAWPRRYPVSLPAAPGETVFSAYLKIGTDGHITVAVPQAELGQGTYTGLPQMLADELGADWRTVGVEAAPLSPLYANPLAAEALFPVLGERMPGGTERQHAIRTALVLVGGSTSTRMFEGPLREAGAAARALLCQAAAARWGVSASACDTAQGFVVAGERRLRFAELAEAAAGFTVPQELALRAGEENRLAGQALPRLDAPAKVDGSANFAADVRLPGMVFASVRQGPVGDTRLVRVDRGAAERVAGVKTVVTTDRWVAAVADTWWAADKGLDALAPRFETRGGIVNSDGIEAALTAALNGPAERIASAGDLSATFAKARVTVAEYRAGLGVHAAIEPAAAAAEWRDGRLRLWVATQAPGLVRAAAARAAGIAEADVVVFSMLAGGSFGARLESDAAEQAALLAVRLNRPVSVQWSRAEDVLHDRYRPPAAMRMSARLAGNGMIQGWQAKIATPPVHRELAARLLHGDTAARLALAWPGAGDRGAVAGGVPFYNIPNLAVDHHPAEIGVPTGMWRSGAHSLTAFATESFIDELAHVANVEAMSFRIAMLGGNARLARCLTSAAALGGWQGGVPGSGQGLACHQMAGSAIAVMAEAHVEGGRRVRVDRLVAAVDCGRIINPDLVRQQIEGGLIWGVAGAVGASTGFSENLAEARGFGGLALPRLADSPEVIVELIRSDAEPGGVGGLGVPAVAPAVANAIQSATGVRLRRLPLVPGEG